MTESDGLDLGNDNTIERVNNNLLQRDVFGDQRSVANDRWCVGNEGQSQWNEGLERETRRER